MFTSFDMKSFVSISSYGFSSLSSLSRSRSMMNNFKTDHPFGSVFFSFEPSSILKKVVNIEINSSPKYDLL